MTRENNSKIISKFLSFFLTLCLCFFTLVGCIMGDKDTDENSATGDKNDDNNENTEDENAEDGKDSNIGSETGDSETGGAENEHGTEPPEYIRTGIYLTFSNLGYQSFSKVKVLSIYDDVYIQNKDKYLICECEIVEDYYKIRNEGEKMTLAVRLLSRTESGTFEEDYDPYIYFSADAMREIFDTEYMIAYTRLPKKSTLVSEKAGEPLQSEEIIFTSARYCFPLTETGLNLKLHETLSDEKGYNKYRNFVNSISEYIYHGMSEEEAKAAITRLDIEQELQFKSYRKVTNKFNNEILDCTASTENIVVKVENIDPYAYSFTLTVKNNGSATYCYFKVKSYLQNDNEWNYFQNSMSLENNQTLPTDFELKPGEECTIKLGTCKQPNPHKFVLSMREYGASETASITVILNFEDWV